VFEGVSGMLEAGDCKPSTVFRFGIIMVPVESRSSSNKKETGVE
jgi:hypothetical protein